MDDSGQQQAQKTNIDVILSGALIGPSKAGETDQVGIGGVTIDIVPAGPGAVTKTIVSGLGGDFNSGLITPAKYKLYFKDPNNKYFHSPTPITVGQDMDIPIYMQAAGGRKGGRRGNNGGYATSTISGTVFALVDKKKQRLAGMQITIKSVKLDPQLKLGKIFKSILKRLTGKKGEQKDDGIKITTTTNLFGMFFSGRTLPKGTYNVYCFDPKGTYLFSTKFVVVKSKIIPPLIFIGFTKEQLEEYKKQKETTKHAVEPQKVEVTEKPGESKQEAAQPVTASSEAAVKQVAINPPPNTSLGPTETTPPTAGSTPPPMISHQTSSEILNETRAQAASEHAAEELRRNENVTVRPAGQAPGPTFTNAPASYTNTSSPDPSNSPPVSPQRPASSRSRGGGAINSVNRATNAAKKMANNGNQALGLVQNVASSPLKWWLLGIGIAIVIFIIIFEGGSGAPAGGGETSQPTPQTTAPSASSPPIPGLTLSLSAPESIDNGQNILYTVDVSYSPTTAAIPLDQIIVYEDVPQGADFQAASGIYQYDPPTRRISWPLSESQNQNQFTFTLTTTQQNFVLTNSVYAKTTATAPPASGAIPGGACSEGSGFCSVENLKKYFGDTTSAQKASIICQRESRGTPGVLNDGCLDGSSVDYSVGLFQINMLAHCPGAFSSYTFNPPSCVIADRTKLDACVAKYSDPIENIKKMVELSANGTNWAPWRTPTNSCGIN